MGADAALTPPAAAAQADAPMPSSTATAAAVTGAALASATHQPIGGNRLTLAIDYAKTVPDMVDAIRGAKETVNFRMFGWQPNGSGAVLQEALRAKAKEGVEVHAIMDGHGSMQIPGTPHWRFAEEMKADGVKLLRTDSRLIDRPRGAIDHGKMLVVDNKTAWVLGHNMAKMFDNWHDVGVRIDGPAAAQAGAEFGDRYRAMGGTLGTKTAAQLEAGTAAIQPAGTAEAKVIGNHPRTGVMPITDDIRSRIDSAKERIWVQSPQFTSKEFADTLTAARARGVDVLVQVNGKSGPIPVMNMASRGFYPQLVDAGVKIFEQPKTSHQKVWLIDDWATVGSFNATRQSAERDFEANVTSSDPGFVKQVKQLFDTDLAVSKEVAPEQAHDRFGTAMSWVRQKTGLQY